MLPGETSAGPERGVYFIKGSKTYPMGKGTTIFIGHTEDKHTCPVAAMEAYRENAVAMGHTNPMHGRQCQPWVPVSPLRGG